jgi:hypothetical protein
MDLLTASLLDLLHELEGRGVPITVGGGFGLYLKRQHLARTGERTLFDALPEPRSTSDLDLFLRVDVLADWNRTHAVAEVIRRLGYVPIPTAKFMQWEKQVLVNGVPQPLKIDLHVGPLGERAADLDADKRRARPKQKIELHARRTEEAISVEEEAIVATLTGNRSTGESHEAKVSIPQAFPYLMMKLHAFDDRKDDPDKDLGRHHALDLYTIIGMMTEQEYERAKELGAAHASDEHVGRARAIVWNHFEGKPFGPPTGSRGAMGLLRIQEHQLFRREFLLQEFTSVLKEIFGIGS